MADKQYLNAFMNNSATIRDVLAADVAVGIWEIYWTRDFQTVNYEYNAPAMEEG